MTTPCMDSKLRCLSTLSAVALVMLGSQVAYAGELNLNAGLSAEYVIQTIDDKDNATEIDANNLIIQPFLSATYMARYLTAQASATHNHVRRSLESADVTNNYTNFKYFARYQIVPNLLSVNVNGAQSYRSQSANSFLVDDFLLNGDNLRKNTTNGAGLNFNLPTGDYIGIVAQLNATTIDSESENQNNNIVNRNRRNFESTNYSGSVAIESGEDLRPFLYDLSGSLQKSDRDIQQDFESQRLNATLGSYVTSELSLRLLGYYESNDITNDQAAESNFNALREFYSYGAGFAWQPAQNRFIELGWNRSTTKGRLGEEDEEDDYLSADVRWSFSSRTSVSGSYTRRFFGDAGSFRFSHNLRNWRSSINYNENVTTNSQLLFNEVQGIFVCANGSVDLSDCSLTDGLDSGELGPDDFLVPGIINNFELNDRVVIRKSLTAQTAVDLRRTTLSASISNSTNEEVEVIRDVDTLTGRLNASLRLSERSTINANISYADIERITEDESTDAIIKEAGISYERRLSRRLFASIGYRYLDRSGGNIGGGGGGIRGINGPLTDRRISAEIRYEFDSNQ